MVLPQYIDPIEYMQQSQALEGAVSSDQLSRLSKLLDRPDQTVKFDLTFGQDQQGRCIVKCHVLANLQVACQRCGQPLELAVDVQSTLCVVTSDDQAKSLPVGYDPLVTGGNEVLLLNIIEDELLLAIPMIPRHEEEKCPINLSNYLKRE